MSGQKLLRVHWAQRGFALLAAVALCIFIAPLFVHDTSRTATHARATSSVATGADDVSRTVAAAHASVREVRARIERSDTCRAAALARAAHVANGIVPAGNLLANPSFEARGCTIQKQTIYLFIYFFNFRYLFSV